MPFDQSCISLVLYLIIAAACSLSSSPPSSSSTQHKNESTIEWSFKNNKFLGSVHCDNGIQNSFVFQKHSSLSQSPVEGYIGMIGLLGEKNNSLNDKHPILEVARNCKNREGNALWMENGDFIFWHKIVGKNRKEFIFHPKIDQNNYSRFTSNSYNIYTFSILSYDTPSIYYSNSPISLKPFLDYSKIQLQALTYTPKQTQEGIEWVLKGSVASNDYVKNARIGFLLIREGINPYDLLPQILGDTEWSKKSTIFNDYMIVIPGKLRNNEPIIDGYLKSNTIPIKQGTFKVLCYLEQDQHYYISQVGHITSTFTNSSPEDNPPPSITFTNNHYHLKTLKGTVERTYGVDKTPKVTFSKFLVQYMLNNQLEKLPDHLQACLLFFPKGIIWRTAQIEELFKKLQSSNSPAAITRDATVCLVTENCTTLPSSCINCFLTENDYEYFTCLFSKSDHKLIYYTEKETLQIQGKQMSILQPKQEEEKEESSPDTPIPEMEATPTGGKVVECNPIEKEVTILPTADIHPAGPFPEVNPTHSLKDSSPSPSPDRSSKKRSWWDFFRKK